MTRPILAIWVENGDRWVMLIHGVEMAQTETGDLDDWSTPGNLRSRIYRSSLEMLDSITIDLQCRESKLGDRPFIFTVQDYPDHPR